MVKGVSMLEQIKEQTKTAVTELIEKAGLQAGQLLVIGCSSSEVLGEKIGTHSSAETAAEIFKVIAEICNQKGILIAAQCCEHLNRAIIVEKATADKCGWQPVNVVPMPKAGGSFATAAYAGFAEPAAVEYIKADAGMDIGDTLIGMHLKAVAVPVRLSLNQIGKAHLTCARVRPKFIGGERAHYDPALL